MDLPGTAVALEASVASSALLAADDDRLNREGSTSGLPLNASNPSRRKSSLHLLWDKSRNTIDAKLAGSSRTLIIYTSICFFAIQFTEKFFRYAVFAINEPFMNVTYGGITLIAWLGMANIFGYACGVIPATCLITRLNPKYRRLLIVITVTWLAFVPNAGFLIPAPAAEIVFRFIGTLPMSIFAGTLVTYLEGRKKTEVYTFIGTLLLD